METKGISEKDLEQGKEVSMAVKRLEERMIAQKSDDYKDFVLENNRKVIGGVE